MAGVQPESDPEHLRSGGNREDGEGDGPDHAVGPGTAQRVFADDGHAAETDDERDDGENDQTQILPARRAEVCPATVAGLAGSLGTVYGRSRAGSTSVDSESDVSSQSISTA